MNGWSHICAYVAPGHVGFSHQATFSLFLENVDERMALCSIINLAKKAFGSLASGHAKFCSLASNFLHVDSSKILRGSY